MVTVLKMRGHFPLFALLLHLAACTRPTRYQVEIYTVDEYSAGTNDNIYLTLHGTYGNTAPYNLELSWYDDMEPGNIDKHDFSRNVDVGDIHCVTLRTTGYDSYLVGYVAVTKYPGKLRYMFNEGRIPLTLDSGGQAELKLCTDVCYHYLPVADNWYVKEMHYDVNKAQTFPKQTKQVGQLTVDARDSAADQSSTISLSKTVSNSVSYTHSYGTAISSSATFTAGIPNIVSGAVTISKSHHQELSFTKINRIEESVSFDFPCVAAAATRVVCRAYQEEYTLRVPYKQVWQHKSQRCEITVEGIANVASDSNITFNIQEI